MCTFLTHCSSIRSSCFLSHSKGPTQNHKWKTLQKLILSYFHNVMQLLTQLTDHELLGMALTETSKLVPYVTSSRKAVKVYLKVWTTALQEDNRLLMASSDMS